MAEITGSGYVLKTQNEWFEEERARYIEIDPKWNLDPSTPDGLKLAVDAEIWANLDELLQWAYNSKDPNKALGIELDVLCALTGIVRAEGTPSTVNLTVSGTAGTIIPAGSHVRSADTGLLWRLDHEVTIGGGGTAAVSATCVDLGATQASAGTITKIVDTVGGWQGVNNSLPATPGTNPETDAELRERRRRSVALSGSNQVDATYAAVAAVAGVRRVKVYENDTASTDSNGLPAHSTAIIVDGGDDDDIAQAIYSKRNPGPVQHQTSGAAVDVPVVSPVTGNSKTISFSRPAYVDITLVVNVTDDGTLPSGIEGEIEQAVLDYVGGDLLDESAGFNWRGFDIGESVPVSRLYTPVNKVIGAYGSSFVSSMTVNAGSSVAIDFDELARFTNANITVNVT